MSVIKAVGSSLKQRVFVAYRSTLTGIGLVAADAVLSTLQDQPLPQWAHVAVAIVAGAFVAYRKKEQEPAKIVNLPIEPPPPSGGTLGGAAVFAAFALALLGSGCAGLGAKGAVTLTKGGTTVTTSISDDGLICSDWTPPVTYFGETCTGVCVSTTAALENVVTLKCAPAAGGVHIVQLRRFRP